jgi:hypothetical protein
MTSGNLSKDSGMVGSLPRSPAVSGWLILPLESITDVVLSELSGSCTLRAACSRQP